MKRTRMSKIKMIMVGSAILAAMAFSPSSSSATTILGESYDQIDYLGNAVPYLTDTEWGLYTATAMPGVSVSYLNVVADAGAFGDTWIVQNLPIPSLSDQPGPLSLSTAFDLQPFGISRGVDAISLSVYTQLDLLPLASAPAPIYSPVSVGAFNHDAEGKAGAGGPRDEPGLPVMNNFILPFGFLNDWHFRSNVPNVEAGYDECGPAAAANSLRWLKAEYGSDVPESLEDLRDKLKNGTHMKTGRPGGTDDDDFIDGKLKYIDDNEDLDLIVKFMDDVHGGADRKVGDTEAKAKGKIPTAKFIFDELNAGEDVEIGFTYLAPERFTDTNGNKMWDPGEPLTDANGNGVWDADGRSAGGHWITATGKIDVFGVKGIFFNEDTKQGEKYWDTNNNGKWDAGEPFVDADGDGVREAGDPYSDLNNNSMWDPGEPFRDSDGDGTFEKHEDKGTDKVGFSWLVERPDGFLELINYPGRHKIDIVVSESIPEPASLGLLLAGGLLVLRRRNR